MIRNVLELTKKNIHRVIHRIIIYLYIYVYVYKYLDLEIYRPILFPFLIF